MTKAELRTQMRQHLRILGPEREEKSRTLAAAIAAHPAFQGGRRVAIFAPLPSEPDVEWLWKLDAPASREFCYPRLAGVEVEFVEVRALEELTPSAWNPAVREPTSPTARIVAPEDIDLILVPGLAFTAKGARLGRGGGFYDRFLTRLPAKTTKLGVCFSVQVLPDLPTEAHDQTVDAVITENGLAPR